MADEATDEVTWQNKDGGSFPIIKIHIPITLYSWQKTIPCRPGLVLEMEEDIRLKTSPTSRHATADWHSIALQCQKRDLELDFGHGIDFAHVSDHFQHFLKFDLFDL